MSSLPTFPDYKKLDLQDKNEIISLTRKFSPHSDYNFISMWSYDTDENVQLSTYKGNLIVQLYDYLTNEPFYSFIGDSYVSETITKIIDHTAKLKVSKSLRLIPEDNFRKDLTIFQKYTIQQDKDNFDYILSVNEQSELKGKKYQDHRKLLNYFLRKFPGIEFSLLDLKEKQTQKKIISVFEEWKKRKGTDTHHSLREYKALQKILSIPDAFKMLSFGLYDKDKLISFIIADLEHDTTSQSHVFKTNQEYKGAAQFLRFQSSLILRKYGYIHLNIEQDMGIPGLRFAKEQWRPVHYLKKYLITTNKK